MNPEKHWHFLQKLVDGISGFTPPQVRLIDQAFASWATLVVADKAAQEAAAKVEPKPKIKKAGES